MADRYWVGGTGSWAATTTNWSATDGGAGGASVPTLADDVFFTSLSNATAYVVTLTTAPVCRSVSVVGPATGNVTIAGTAAWSIYGSMTLAATGVTWTTTSAITFAATTTGFTITTNGVALDNAITFNGVGGAWSLGSALTTGSTRTVTLTNGTFDLANYTLTCGFFSSSNSNTRTIAFGTGQINLTGNNGSVWASSTLTNLTITGTPIVNATYSGATGTRTIGTGVLSESQAITFNITAGTDIVVCTGNFKDLIFTGFAGSITNTTRSIYGNLTLGAGMTFVTGANVTSIIGTSGTQLITSNGVTVNNQITFSGAGGTFRLQDALTVASTRLVVLTGGTLELNDKNITCGGFNTSSANTRTLAFGTGQINLTSNAGTIWNFNAGTGLTVTGSATVNATYSGSTGTRTLFGYGAGTAVINVNVTAGTDIVAMPNAGFNNINFTGFTGSVVTGIGGTGNITLGAGMTITSASSWSMFGSSGTQVFTSNGVTLDAPMTFNGPSGSYQLQDNLTLGSTRFLSLTNGALNLNGQTATCGTFTSGTTNTRSIAFNGGTITVSGATFTASGANLTTSGSGTINMTSASSKTFTGNSVAYPTLNQGGAGALVITGANTFANIINTVQPATITFPASTTTTVENFIVNGTVGNLVTINSSSSGTQATLAYTGVNTIDVNFLSIKDSNATPGIATWYAGDTSVDVSNNNGWFFVVQPQAFDTHDGNGRKKDETERKRLADKNKKRRAEIIAAFEYIVEGKPIVAEEIAEEFIITRATNNTPMVVNYDGLLNSLDRVDKIFTVMIDLDDEDVLLLL